MLVRSIAKEPVTILNASVERLPASGSVAAPGGRVVCVIIAC